MQPLVSVIVPVYNCERFVGEALRSALAQDHPRTEIVAVDDGSTDASAQVLRGFGAAVRVVSVPNGGPSAARNAGMRAALGDYIAFLDADDVWLPGKLSAQVARLEAEPAAGACYTGWHVWPAADDGSFVRPALPALPALIDGGVPVDAARSGWVYDQFLLSCEMLTTTVMLRASVARQVGEFDTGLRVGEDYDYWLRLSRQVPIVRLDCTAALYRVLPASASRTAHAVNFEQAVLLSALQRFGTDNPGGAPVDTAALEHRLEQLSFQHGYLHLRQGDARVALQAFGQSLKRRSWQPRLWLHSLNACVRVATGRATRRAAR